MDRHQNYIPDDGYTELGYIAARPGLHGMLRFKFRPVCVSDQSQWVKGNDSLSGPAWSKKCATLMAARIVSWSETITDANGIESARPVTPAAILRLKPALFTRLYGILLGTDPSDLDPDWSDTERDEQSDYQVAACEGDINVGMARTQANEKNSG